MAKKFNKKTWLINQLRRLIMRYPSAIKATNRTREEYYIPSKSGKPMKRIKFTCEMCGKKDMKRSQMNLDHKNPVIKPGEGFVDWNVFIESLFCDEENLQLICEEPCHRLKTEAEDRERLKK